MLRCMFVTTVKFSRPYTDPQDKLHWKDNPCLAHTYLIMSWKAVLSKLLFMLCRSDLTLVCSPLELSLLQSLYCIPSHKLCNAPFFTEAHSEPQRESMRAHFMTIGNWKHPPNRDGVQWLCQSIWPAIQWQLPHAELHIYGAHMSGAAQQHHKPVSLLNSCTDLPHKWSEPASTHSRSADSQPTLACLGCLHPRPFRLA